MKILLNKNGETTPNPR